MMIRCASDTIFLVHDDAAAAAVGEVDGNKLDGRCCSAEGPFDFDWEGAAVDKEDPSDNGEVAVIIVVVVGIVGIVKTTLSNPSSSISPPCAIITVPFSDVKL